MWFRRRHLREYTKQGVDSKKYAQDEKAQAAFVGLKGALVENAELHVPDFDAAMRPEESKRPFELYVDTCDHAWGCTLAQRQHLSGLDDTEGEAVKVSGPRPIAVHGHALSKTEQAWSAFEREMFGMREALAAVHHIVKGFPVIVYTTIGTTCSRRVCWVIGGLTRSCFDGRWTWRRWEAGSNVYGLKGRIMP